MDIWQMLLKPIWFPVIVPIHLQLRENEQDPEPCFDLGDGDDGQEVVQPTGRRTHQ